MTVSAGILSRYVTGNRQPLRPAAPHPTLSVTGNEYQLLCGREGNRRSSVALAMRVTVSGIMSAHRLSGLKREAITQGYGRPTICLYIRSTSVLRGRRCHVGQTKCVEDRAWVGNSAYRYDCTFLVVSDFYPLDAMLARFSCRHVSVCPSVCPSHAGIVSKWLNVESRKQRHTIAQGR